MNLETVVLGFLNEQPMSGYDLSKKIDASVGFFWHATHPQIYTCLRKLESRGFVTFTHELQPSGPARKIYTITADGKRFLLDSLSNVIQPFEVKFPLLVAMFHGSELGKEHWISILESQLEEQKAKLQLYQDIRKEIPTVDPDQNLSVFLKLRTVEFGIGYQKYFINWLKETLEELKT